MTAPLRKARHLVLRFFGHYVARPLSPDEQRYVHEHLSGPCAALFWKQSVADQRHAITVARRVAVTLPDDSEAIEAALLHDVGKWRPNPGPVARSIATVLELMRLPMTQANVGLSRSWTASAPSELEEARCGELAVTFARLHPSPAPERFDRHRWQVLSEADE